MKEVKKIVSYGGGTNSTAMLIGMVNEGLRPDAILFADTGGEKPETYSYVKYFSDWLVSKGFPAIDIVKYETKAGEVMPLEKYLLEKKVLPPIAYGFKSCSEKYKTRPVQKFIKNHFPGYLIERYMGFDANEKNRLKPNPVRGHTNVYKLVEWQWNRERCVQEILKAGLCLPGKSSCFFCPNMTRHEVLRLSPDLQERAVKIERTAAPNLMELSGLGRDKKWEDWIKADANQEKIFDDDDYRNVPPCECIDG